MRCVRDGTNQFTLYSDSEMERYSWDRTAYPSCSDEAAEPEEPNVEEAAPGEGQPVEPETPPETEQEEPGTPEGADEAP